MPMSLTIALCGLLLLVSAAMGQDNGTSFPPISRDNKPWTRWWWLGNAVDEKSLTHELQQIHDAGFGGVEITPLYGAVGYESRYINFLSPKWMQMVRHTGEEGKRIGLGIDMATGTGWPFGGPWISPTDADASLVLDGKSIHEKPTRMKVKRAAPGDEGWVVNPYSVSAIEKYLKPFSEAFADFPRDLIRCQFHDSFEYSGNWTKDLPAKFKEMHGYDIHDRAAELAGQGDNDIVPRVRSDYRQTLSQMHLDYLKVWVKWSRDHGALARNQAHGSPGNLLDLYAIADIAETETFGSNHFPIPGFRSDPDEVGEKVPEPLAAKFASSAMNVTGRNITSCETFTWLREHFRASMTQMKPEADQMFLAGINHLIYHGTCFSPDGTDWPGWNFYASVEFNPQNSIWRDLPVMNDYFARCQSILQSGKHDNDILLYWPIYDMYDQPDRTPETRVTVHPTFLNNSALFNAARSLDARGYSYDYISDAQIEALKSIEPYKLILVPKCRNMPVETLEKLSKLGEAGAIVLFEDALPTDVPGLGNLSARRARFKEILNHFTPSQVGKLDELLSQSLVRREALVDSGLRFIRRKHAEGNHYFYVNLTDKPIAKWLPIASACASAVILDPLTGKSGLAATRSTPTGASVYLQLAPGESFFLRTFASTKVHAEPWKWKNPMGDAIEIAGTWQVDFIGGGPKLPASFKTDKLESWTTLGDEEAKRFAGAARYTIEFDLPDTRAADWQLDLGDVRESARVTINGKSVGTLWSLPMHVNVGAFVQPGKNTLSIEVTNLSANRIRDLDARGVVWKKFHEINFVNIHYKPFDASTWKLVPSGLLGPVKIVPLELVKH